MKVVIYREKDKEIGSVTSLGITFYIFLFEPHKWFRYS